MLRPLCLGGLRHHAEVVYLAPVAVAHRDGTRSPAAMAGLEALISDRLAHIDLSCSDVFEPAALEQLALASGGLPGLLLGMAAEAVSVANTDRLHFEEGELQRVAPQDVDIAVPQLGFGAPIPEYLLRLLRQLARTGDPATAARVEPYGLVYVDGDDVFGAVHPALVPHLGLGLPEDRGTD